MNIHTDGLVQERRNSSALAMELHLSCTNPLIEKCFKLLQCSQTISMISSMIAFHSITSYVSWRDVTNCMSSILQAHRAIPWTSPPNKEANDRDVFPESWWCHAMKTLSLILAFCEMKPQLTAHWPFVRGIHCSSVVSPHTGSVMQSFDVFSDFSFNMLLDKQWNAGD